MRCNLRQGQYFIGGAVRNGLARHAKHNATRFILHVVVAAGIFHLTHGRRAIVAHASQHDSVCVTPHQWAADLNSTSTDGLWRLTAGPSSTTANVVGPTATDMELRTARSDIGMPWQDALPMYRLLTVIWHRPLRRAAKLVVVKPGGICCVMTMAGISAGRCTKTSLMASVPPVEAPMKINFSVDRRPSSPAAGAGADTAVPELTGSRWTRRTWATAATRILSQ